ncbi:retrovirus-related pol polyprotein from transposon TNT 1-94 [Tanacetum coccineum]
MDSESAHTMAASKVPMLKPSEFELWRMRIEQYIQMIDYALWEVIENGYTAPKSTVVEGVEKFNSIKDAKLLLEAIKEGVYVCHPPGFEDPDFLDKVYKVEKALYKGDILLVQVYVDDIIFGSTKKDLCVEFEKLMHEKFQMSSTGELTFFLGLQVQQKKDDIFISQDKYVGEILKKFGFTEVKTTSTPMETQKPLLKDEDGEEVDVHMYRSMIGSLMYLTSSRPGSMFVVCACARYQVNSKAKIVNGEVQLQALVDGKKLIITESTIRRDLQLEDAEGVYCLPNATMTKK